MGDRDAAGADGRDAGALVAELARNSERLRVALDRAGARQPSAETGEGERQHGGAHLRAEALPLELPAEPGAGRHRPVPLERPRGQRLHTDRPAFVEGDQAELPASGTEPLELRRVVGEEVGLVQAVGPRGLERHELRVVDPARCDLIEPAQLEHGGEPQFEARGPQAQARQRMREPGQEVAPADNVEAELGVELPRPVVLEGFEEDHLVVASCHVEGVLDDRTAETTSAVGTHRFDILDLGGDPIAAHLAVRGDAIVHDRREEACRHRAHDQALRIVQLCGEVVVAPRFGDRGRRSGRHEPVELDLLHHRGVDPPVGLAAVLEHEMCRAHVPVVAQRSGERVVALLQDHAAMMEALHQRVGLRHNVGGVDTRILDRQVVRVVDVRRRVGEEPGSVCRRYLPLGCAALHAAAEGSDAIDAHRPILAITITTSRASVRGTSARVRRARARARGRRRRGPRRCGRAAAAAPPGRRADSGSCRGRAGR